MSNEDQPKPPATGAAPAPREDAQAALRSAEAKIQRLTQQMERMRRTLNTRMSATKLAIVVGVGPGIGLATARRFARENYAVAMVSRNKQRLLEYEALIADEGGTAIPVHANAGNPSSLIKTIQALTQDVGTPEALVYNAGVFVRGSVEGTTPEQYLEAYHVNCLGAIAAAQAVLPAMRKAQRGTILFTGATAAKRGSAGFSALATSKAGLRMFSQSLAREVQSEGIHVAHVVVDGLVDLESTRQMDWASSLPDHAFISPDAVAEVYWQLHRQPRCAWTQELDVRPHVEEF